MKLTLTLLLLLVGMSNAQSQNYKRYYELCYVADSLDYVGLRTQAMDSLKLAFISVPYVHSDEYISAYQRSIKLNDYKEAAYFGKMAVIQSGEKSIIKTNSKAFQKSDYYEHLSDSLDYYVSLFHKRVNADYIKLIDSLVYIDQYIIRNNREYKGLYSIDKGTLPENLFDLDSSNWKVLCKWIDSVGFPSEQLVGKHGYDEAWAILHHNLRLQENEQYHTEMVDFVYNGLYRPNDLMLWYEQYQMQVHGTTFFTTWDGNISKENLNRIEQNRSAFYLKGLNSFSLEKNGRFMNKKW